MKKKGEKFVKNKTNFLIILIFLVIILVITNPTKAEYIEWVKQQVAVSSNTDFERAIVYLIGNSLLDSTTFTQNFVIFTLFKTNIDESHSYIAIGILKNFIYKCFSLW